MWLSGSSWADQPPWRTVFDPDTETLTILDPAGTPRARLTRVSTGTSDGALSSTRNGAPAPGSERESRAGAPDTVAKARGWLRRTLDVDSLQRGRGQLFEGQRAVLEVVGEPVQQISNGRLGAWRRSRKGTSFVVVGRGYGVRHVGRRRTELSRDGAAVAVLRRRGWYWRRSYGDDPPRSGLRALVALDQVDELAVVLCCSVFGPPGRPGALSEFFCELSP